MQALYDGFLRNGFSELQKFYTYQKAEIMKILEEESLQLIKVVAEIQDKLTKICINTEVNEHPADEIRDSSCKDVHATTDISPSTCPKVCTRLCWASSYVVTANFFSLYIYAEPLPMFIGYRNICFEDIDKLVHKS